MSHAVTALPSVRRGARPVTLLAALILGLLPASLPAADSGPDDVVRRVSEEVLEIIREHRDGFDRNPDAYFRAVDQAMGGFIDYDSIARAVMSKYWSQASEDQRERFIEQFRRGLVRSYARAMLEFDQQKVKVLPVLDKHRRDNRALVRMEVTGANGRVYPVQYSMAENEAGRWQVRNVIVDGVNLGITYRNQFSSAMQSGDAAGNIDTVIESWSVATTPGS